MATATAKPPKVTPADVAKFAAMKGRVLDYFNHNAEAIAGKTTVHVWAGLFGEMEWLCGEIDRLAAAAPPADPAKYEKVRAWVMQVCDDQADVILTGAFIAMSARKWVRYQLLVKLVEAAYRRLLDMEDVARLGRAVADERRKRVTLEDPDDDDGE
jgi:hypothetical protein